jgi:hypothetical protein
LQKRRSCIEFDPGLAPDLSIPRRVVGDGVVELVVVDDVDLAALVVLDDVVAEPVAPQDLVRQVRRSHLINSLSQLTGVL